MVKKFAQHKHSTTLLLALSITLALYSIALATDCCNCTCDYSTYTPPTITGQGWSGGTSSDPIIVESGGTLSLSVDVIDIDESIIKCPESSSVTDHPQDGTVTAIWSVVGGGTLSSPSLEETGKTYYAPTLTADQCEKEVTIHVTPKDGTTPSPPCANGTVSGEVGSGATIYVKVVKPADCNGASVTANTGAFKPNPVANGSESTCALSSSKVDPPCCADTAPPTYSWTVTATEYKALMSGTFGADTLSSTIDNASSAAATLKVTPNKTGYWKFTVKVTVTWNCASGTCIKDSTKSIELKCADECPGSNVDANATAFDKNPVGRGIDSESTLSANKTDPTGCNDPDGPTWSWKVTASEYTATSGGTYVSDSNYQSAIIQPNDNSAAATLKVKSDKIGYWRFKVTATAIWECASGTLCTNKDETDWIYVRVIKIIEQDHDLWWFNGEDPGGGYYIKVTLTANGISSGTLEWTVTAGTDKVNLNNGGADLDTVTATGGDNTVDVKSTAKSGGANDVTIELKVNNVKVDEHKLTVWAPDHLEQFSLVDYRVHAVIPGIKALDGYESLYGYKIKDQFDVILPYPVPVNEDVDGNGVPSTVATIEAASTTVYVGETWEWSPEVGFNGCPPNNLTDTIAKQSNSWTPDPMGPQTPRTATKIDYNNGALYCGSSTNGKGVKVKTVRWQIYIDHGRHE